jgi:hypothetical protein
VTDRICTLSFDEVEISKKLCYDELADQVLGMRNTACVRSIRGIFGKWKQVIYYDWEKATKYEDVLNIIGALSNIGIDVRALVSDMGPKNTGIWSDLNLGKVKQGVINKTWFQHPVTDKKIFVFPDFPHLIKLLRTHLLDSSINLPDGKVLDKKMYMELLKVQTAEFRLTHKLTYRHVHMRGKQRQHVRSAFQTFSHRVSKSVRLLLPGHVSQANFIELVNDVSDLLNCRLAQPNYNPCKCPYGMQPDEQDHVLDTALETFRKIRIGSRKEGSYAPFQKGWIMTSLRELYADLSSEYGIQFLLTSRLNQDHLENFFSQIRGVGGFNMNPTALELKHRIKKIICCNTLTVPKTASVRRDSEDVGMVSEQLFSRLVASEQQTMEKLSTRNPSSEILTQEAIDRLTSIDWTVTLQNIAMEDLSCDERSHYGGIEYVAGFIANKFIERYPELSNVGSGEISSGFWVSFLARGVNFGLVEPSSFWYAVFMKWDELFRAVHPEETIGLFPGVVFQFKIMISTNCPDAPSDVIQYFSKMRVLMRIQHLNRRVEDAKFQLQEQRRLEFLKSRGAFLDEDDPMEERPD